MIEVLLLLAYLCVGFIFTGLIKNSDGEPMTFMIVLWPVAIPIMAICGVINLSYIAGEIINDKITSFWRRVWQRKSK